MINGNEEQEDIETEYLDQEETDNKRAGNHRKTHGEETKPSTVKELLEALASDHTCIQAPQIIGPSNSIYTFDTGGALVQVSPIDGASQRYISTTLRQRIVHLCQHSLLAVHPSEREVYDTMRQHCLWSHMADDVYSTVTRCMLCTSNRRTKNTAKFTAVPHGGPS